MNTWTAWLSRPCKSGLIALVLGSAACIAAAADPADPAKPRTRAEVQQEAREAVRSGYSERQLRDSYLPVPVGAPSSSMRRDAATGQRLNDAPPAMKDPPSTSMPPRSTP